MSDPSPSDNQPINPSNAPVDSSARRRALTSDEMIAVVVAFGAIGSILWWGLTRREEPFNFAGLLGNQNLSSQTADQGILGLNGQNEAVPGFGSGVLSGEGDRPSIASTAPSPSGTLNPATGTIVPGGAGQSIAGALGAGALAVPFVGAALPAGNTAPTVVPPTGSGAAPAAPTASPSPIAASPSPVAPAAVAPVPPVLSVPDATKAVSFSDVPPDYWAYPFIDALAARGIATGFTDGTFKPDVPISRAEYAAFIQGVFEQPENQDPIAFKDVQPDYWAVPAIDKAVKIGFLRGYPGDVFQATQPISRMQVLLSLNNGLGLSQPEPPEQVVQVFTDNGQIPAWALPSIASATKANMVVTYPTTEALVPDQPATRGEVAAILHQALVAAGKLPPVESSYIVKP